MFNGEIETLSLGGLELGMFAEVVVEFVDEGLVGGFGEFGFLV